jgi:hypothetical protein
VQDLGGGIWRWTARHPEWHPGRFGAEVASYALVEPRRTVLVDPLVPAGDEELWSRLDGVVAGRVTVLITIGYHVRSSAEVYARYPKTTVWGPRTVARRLADTSSFRELAPGAGPPGVRAFPIGRPRRSELPVLVESHRALAFGDAVVGVGQGLRMWCTEPVDERREHFYAERFAPTLEPILAEEFDAVLVTHGPAVVRDGRAALRDAIRRPPWYHHG